MPRKSSIKKPDTYEALLREGASKEKAARIANAQAAGDRPDRAGGLAAPYEERSRSDLYALAKRLEIAGRSSMTKPDLIAALRAR